MFQHATIVILVLMYQILERFFDAFLTNGVFKVLQIVENDGNFSFGAFHLLVI